MHCAHCHEVEFDAGEGERFAGVIKRIAAEIDARESAELARIRKKLKLTQLGAARITGGGPNAFSRGSLCLAPRRLTRSRAQSKPEAALGNKLAAIVTDVQKLAH